MVAHFEERVLVRIPARPSSSKQASISRGPERRHSRTADSSGARHSTQSGDWCLKLCSVREGHLNIYQHNGTTSREALQLSAKLDVRHQIRTRRDEGRWHLQVYLPDSAPSTNDSRTLATPQAQAKARRPTTPRLRTSESLSTLFSRPGAGSSFSGRGSEAPSAWDPHSIAQRKLDDQNGGPSSHKRTAPTGKVHSLLPKLRLRRRSRTASGWDEEEGAVVATHELAQAGSREASKMQRASKYGAVSRRDSVGSSFGSPVTPVDELEPILEIQTDDETTMLKCVGALNAWVHPSQAEPAEPTAEASPTMFSRRKSVQTIHAKEHKWLRSPSTIFTSLSERSNSSQHHLGSDSRQIARHSVNPAMSLMATPSKQTLGEDEIRRDSTSSTSTATFRKRPSSDFISKLMARPSSRNIAGAAEGNVPPRGAEDRRVKASVESFSRDAHSQIGVKMLSFVMGSASSTTHSSTTSPPLSQQEEMEDDGDTANTSPGQRSAILLESPELSKTSQLDTYATRQSFDRSECSTSNDSAQRQSGSARLDDGGVGAFPSRSAKTSVTLSSLRPMSPVHTSKVTHALHSQRKQPSLALSVDMTPTRSNLSHSHSQHSAVNDLSQTAPDEPLYSKWRNDSLNGTRKTIGLGLQGLRNRSVTVSEGLNTLSASSKNCSSSAEPNHAALDVSMDPHSMSPSSISTSNIHGKSSGSSVELDSPVQGAQKPARSRSMLRLLDFLDKREANERSATAPQASSAYWANNEQLGNKHEHSEAPRKRGAGAIKRIFSSEWQRKTAVALTAADDDGRSSQNPPQSFRESPRSVSPSTRTRARASIDAQGSRRPSTANTLLEPAAADDHGSPFMSLKHYGLRKRDTLIPVKSPLRRGSAPSADVLAVATTNSLAGSIATSQSTAIMSQRTATLQAPTPLVSQRILPPNEIIATMDRMRLESAYQLDVPADNHRGALVASPCPTNDVSGASSQLTCTSSTATAGSAIHEAAPFTSISNLFPQKVDDDQRSIIQASLKSKPSTETMSIRSPPLAAKNLPTSAFVRGNQRSLPAPRRAVRKSQTICKADAPSAPRLPRQRSSKFSAEARGMVSRPDADESQDENGVYLSARPILPLSKLSFGAEDIHSRSAKSSMCSDASSTMQDRNADVRVRAFGDAHELNVDQALQL